MGYNEIALFSLLLLASPFAYSQVSENFDDGDILANPAWTGDTGSFIVNAAGELQSADTLAGNTFQISTASNLLAQTQWELDIRLAFNPSSANYIDIFLASYESQLTGSSNSGYFVRLGNTSDEVSLYRLDPGLVVTKIIDGMDGMLNKSSNKLKLKVTRDNGGRWMLYVDASATSNTFQLQGATIDSTYTASNWFGISIRQSTASFFKKHFFDNIRVDSFIPDILPPSLVGVIPLSLNNIEIQFSEAITAASADPGNYNIPGQGNPIAVNINPNNPKNVLLMFDRPLTNGTMYTLTVHDIADLAGNVAGVMSIPFLFRLPQRYDVVIDEIMADPTPGVGLPAYEWIELRNISPSPVNLRNWRIADASDTSASMGDFLLEPDSFLIVCSASAGQYLSVFGKTLTVAGFPALNNDKDRILLLDPNGEVIHGVAYKDSWYQSVAKKDGGWSLEMIDHFAPCVAEKNWKASDDPRGGTPGKINSIDGNNTDSDPPRLLYASLFSDTTIILVFDEPLSQDNEQLLSRFMLQPSPQIAAVSLVPPLFDSVKLVTRNQLVAGEVYSLTVSGVTDCAGNAGISQTVKIGVPQPPVPLDIVINEILFNPPPGGSDYVELYNRSDKLIDLKELFIANRNSAGEVASLSQLSPVTRLFAPGEFLAFTTDPVSVARYFTVLDPAAVIKVNKLPSLPDDKGNVVLVDGLGTLLDEVAYSQKWHFPLLTNREGVSLERSDVNGSSQQSNFHSAATTAGYGTPGYKNSQERLIPNSTTRITIVPPVFSPDNDGIDDFAEIRYEFPSPGYVANITLFSANGRPVRFLQKNALSGISGYYRWDGLDDQQQPLSQGIYVIVVDVFNAEGKTEHFKKTIVLARRQ